jgi:hypothetical protein
VQEEYQSLKSCAAGASAHFRTDLEKILSALDRFSGFFGEVENTLEPSADGNADGNQL